MTTVAQTIAIASRGRIIRAAVGIALIIAGLLAAQRHLYNIFAGPFPADIAALGAAGGPGDLERYYLTVAADRAYQTGFYLEETTNGVVTGRENYYALAVGDRLLLVQTRATSPRTDVTGYLEAPRPDVRRQVIADIEGRDPSLEGIFLPMQLTEGDLRVPGYLLVFGVPLLLGWMLWTLLSGLFWLGSPMRHPIARDLGRFGDAGQVIGAIDAELAADHRLIGPLRLTPTWLIRQGGGQLQATRHQDIVWIYKTVKTYRSYGIPVGKRYIATICDRHGKVILLWGKREDLVNQMLTAAAQRAPWAIMGYQAEIEQAWRRNRATLVAGVDQRLGQLLPR